ncbi:uncharacterized protein Dwil_GK27328 [Drosophila willistoni]|uniref:tRNA/rRNA methyltransferase SpoU type domain-containing protein n=1 Tax=Drosophila willistoni TaxID=7260 RepID=A0A0Q9WPK7_DROWI|nr:uncharacterized protein Dwil_GK27328 [Drosophila willistoni]
MSAFEGKKAAASSMEHLQFVANVLAILQLQIRKFPSTDTNLLLNKLWSLCLSGDQVHPLAGQIIFTFSDDLAHRVGSSPEMQKVIQHLVQSKEKTDRKTGYSLMRKLKEYVDPNYISALEHLEEQQMPNNLVSLLDKLKSTTDISPWTRILYLKLFHSENELVLYETVKYIANNLTISHLTDWNLIDEFLAATNGTIFHDDIEVFKNFVFSSGVESIVEALVTIDKLSLRDYLFFIETMYKNLMVKYWDHDSLLDKIKNCDNFGAEIVFFNKISLDSNLTCWNTSAASEPGVVPLVRGTSSSQSDGELIVLSTRNHNEASLNDLMETCNAFGVRTLVLNKLTNLGIRAAGELGIRLGEPESLHEYLREKKMKNYKIVGIENMERSHKLASTQKTILVLGEDHQGTADNLKDLLDSTIVLPLSDVKSSQNMAIYFCS